jgi:hypothetical protein
MLKKTFALLVLAVVTAAKAGTPAPAAISPTVAPSDISYNNVSLSWLHQWAQLSPLDIDSNGIALGLEYSPANNFYVAANGAWSDMNFSIPGLHGSANYWTLNSGIGGYIPLTGNIHFVTEVGASYAELTSNSVVIPHNGWGVYVTPHLRAKFGAFEAHAGVTYNSNDSALADWSGFLRLLYEVCPSADIFATGTIGLSDSNGLDDVFGLNLGVRYKF